MKKKISTYNLTRVKKHPIRYLNSRVNKEILKKELRSFRMYSGVLRYLQKRVVVDRTLFQAMQKWKAWVKDGSLY